MSKYEDEIKKGLNKVREKTTEKEVVELNEIKLVVLSDQHRGTNDGADDFRKCKAAYHAALGYYFEAGFALYVLGDVEELWENRPKPVIKTYQDTLELEGKFVQEGKYLRFFGNHDDEWQYQRRVDKYLKKYIATGNAKAMVKEGHTLEVQSKGKKLGELFFVHGHQGTSESDKFSWLSRLFVRYIWRPFQRLTGISATTPAKNFNLRLKHETAMHGWAKEQKGLILISGHTHHPVFTSESHESFLQREIDNLRLKLKSSKAAKDKQELHDQLKVLVSRLNWVLAKSNGVRLEIPQNQKPCYFNTGCCSFPDGDITGIEIEDGSIRLVRWPDDQGNPQKKILREDSLADVFLKCQ
jgi:UDP-2,3-diacylglucosamine pyrophosphatase LpxH